jgi:hypothetical protein
MRRSGTRTISSKFTSQKRRPGVLYRTVLYFARFGFESRKAKNSSRMSCLSAAASQLDLFFEKRAKN